MTEATKKKKYELAEKVSGKISMISNEGAGGGEHVYPASSEAKLGFKGGFIEGFDAGHASAMEEVNGVVKALDGILEIGKRNMENPKYDGYFRTAKEELAKFRGESNG